MLQDDEDVMTMFSVFANISKPICLKLYITTTDTPTQTCSHPPPIFISSLNLESLDEYFDEAMNLESSFEEPTPPPQKKNYLIVILLFNYL